MKRNEIEHALHDEAVSSYLNKAGEYQDWVIISSFYSALHFVRGKIFPFKTEVGGKKFTFDNFHSYHTHLRQSGRNIDRHSLLCQLVHTELGQVYSSYKSLYDLSKNARYIQHKYDNTISENALADLKVVKEFCYTKK